MKISVVLVVACLAGMAGCAGMLCACIQPTTAVVAGRVTAPDGEPLAGALIRGRLSTAEPTCTVGQVAGVDSTDALGRYRTTLIAFRSASKCVFVEVLPPAGSVWRDTILGPFQLMLREDEPVDYLLLDVTLVR